MASNSSVNSDNAGPTGAGIFIAGDGAFWGEAVENLRRLTALSDLGLSALIEHLNRVLGIIVYTQLKKLARR